VKRRALWAATTLAVLGGAAAAVFFLAGQDAADDTTPTTSTTTSLELPPGSVAPLTGVRVDDEEGLRLLARPALAVKVDNHPDGVPGWGLADADVVMEIRVEGISRFVAVFHSRDVGDVGPVRSARTSDPDLLAMLGRPLSAWSGANPATTSLMRATPWIQDVSVDRVPDAYRRDRSRRAPHNLVLDARVAFDAAEDPVTLPEPLFDYREEGRDPAGDPVAGLRLTVGLSRSEYVWDVERAGWLRWSDGEAVDDVGDDAVPQLAPANVVVLETEYAPSPADERSPEAVTLGEGRAWVFSGGRTLEARWERSARTAAWRLVAADGSAVELSRGPTWVALPSVGVEPVLLSREEADRIRSR
jgi:hypothetical protein